MGAAAAVRPGPVHRTGVRPRPDGPPFVFWCYFAARSAFQGMRAAANREYVARRAAAAVAASERCGRGRSVVVEAAIRREEAGRAKAVAPRVRRAVVNLPPTPRRRLIKVLIWGRDCGRVGREEGVSKQAVHECVARAAARVAAALPRPTEG